MSEDQEMQGQGEGEVVARVKKKQITSRDTAVAG